MNVKRITGMKMERKNNINLLIMINLIMTDEGKYDPIKILWMGFSY